MVAPLAFILIKKFGNCTEDFERKIVSLGSHEMFACKNNIKKYITGNFRYECKISELKGKKNW